MVKTKTKPLFPSLREKKRYLAYEIISRQKFYDTAEVNKAIFDAAKEYLGNLGMASAGILMLDDLYNPKLQRGIIRVNNRHVDNLKASLIFVKNIKEREVIIRSIGVSGILRKTQQKYLN